MTNHEMKGYKLYVQGHHHIPILLHEVLLTQLQLLCIYYFILQSSQKAKANENISDENGESLCLNMYAFKMEAVQSTAYHAAKKVIK